MNQFKLTFMFLYKMEAQDYVGSGDLDEAKVRFQNRDELFLQTAISYAIESGYADILRYLMVDLGVESADLITDICEAMNGCYTHCLDILLDNGGDEEYGGKTELLNYAIHLKDMKLIDYLHLRYSFTSDEIQETIEEYDDDHTSHRMVSDIREYLHSLKD